MTRKPLTVLDPDKLTTADRLQLQADGFDTHVSRTPWEATVYQPVDCPCAECKAQREFAKLPVEALIAWNEEARRRARI